jgi:hypothetical protein
MARPVTSATNRKIVNQPEKVTVSQNLSPRNSA